MFKFYKHHTGNYMGTIKLLDCTLRDGGHINQGKFGKNVIKSVIENLVKAKIDIIEAGFLWDHETDDDTARFHSLEKLKRYLPDDLRKSKISLMADNVDLSKLEPYDGTVDFIRLSFRKTEFDWAEKNAEIIMDKGYKCYINPIHGSAFTDDEYLEIIDRVNKLNPFGFSIVDTFGAMRQEDLGRIYYLIEHNLNCNITLGVHLHENLGLAYSLAQYIMNISAPTRNMTIDGALFGMGKVPGNLCIEQIMDYMNNAYRTNYPTEPVYDAIDEFIMPIRERVTWGYSIPYALSGQCSVHRTYAEYLTQKERLRTKDIRRLLSKIDSDNAEVFNKDYIENLYQHYMGVEYDDSASLNELNKQIAEFSKIILVAPGNTIREYAFDDNIVQDACIISVNFIFDSLDTTFNFFTNAKRLSYVSNLDYSKLIITSNLMGDVEDAKYIVTRNELVYHEDVYCDDSTLMVLNLIKHLGKKKVYIAGFDGFRKGENNFYDQILERKVRADDYNFQSRIQILRDAYSEIEITFLTPSVYDVNTKSGR